MSASSVSTQHCNIIEHIKELQQRSASYEELRYQEFTFQNRFGPD